MIIYICQLVQYCDFLSSEDIKQIQQEIYPYTINTYTLTSIISPAYPASLAPANGTTPTAVTTPSNCEAYKLLKHTEIFSGRGDVHQMVAETIGDCCLYCTQLKKCKSFTYLNKYCYLK